MGSRRSGASFSTHAADIGRPWAPKSWQSAPRRAELVAGSVPRNTSPAAVSRCAALPSAALPSRAIDDGALAFGPILPLYCLIARTKPEPLSAIETIRDDFASLDDWEDRYRYVIELGYALEPLSEEAHNDANKVRGCVSQVWLEREARKTAAGATILHYRGDSDSHLVRGLIAIAIALFSDRMAQHILAIDAFSAFRELGLEQHLTPQRSNGVRAMIERIRADAAAT